MSWFRRRSFGSAEYADLTPKWHLLAEREGLTLVAACEYRYSFLYETPMEQDEEPDVHGTSCRKCLATLPPKTAPDRKPVVVRFPTEEEQRRGMTIVPRHKRTIKQEEPSG